MEILEHADQIAFYIGKGCPLTPILIQAKKKIIETSRNRFLRTKFEANEEQAASNVLNK